MLPFYEWFLRLIPPERSDRRDFLGVVLNAAFYALGVLRCSGSSQWNLGCRTASIMVVGGVLSAILAIFYAFQQEDWRCLLSFSSAENATVAIAVLGVSSLFVSSFSSRSRLWLGL